MKVNEQFRNLMHFNFAGNVYF